MRTRTTAAHIWMVATTLHLVARVRSRGTDDVEERDRGDVPGWVMITVMTVIRG